MRACDDTHHQRQEHGCVWRQTRRRHSSSSCSSGSPPQHSREKALPAYVAMVAQPHLPRVHALQGWVVIDVERLEGGGDIVVWGGWGVLGNQ